MLRVDATHSYITEREIIRLGNSDPLRAFINYYLSFKNLRGQIETLFCAQRGLDTLVPQISVLKLEKVTEAVHLWPYETILSSLSG